MPVYTGNMPYRNKSASTYKPEYLPDVLDVIVLKAASRLFCEVVNYLNFRLSTKSAGYYNNVAKELKRIKKKAEVQRKD